MKFLPRKKVRGGAGEKAEELRVLDTPADAQVLFLVPTW